MAVKGLHPAVLPAPGKPRPREVLPDLRGVESGVEGAAASSLSMCLLQPVALGVSERERELSARHRLRQILPLAPAIILRIRPRRRAAEKGSGADARRTR